MWELLPGGWEGADGGFLAPGVTQSTVFSCEAHNQKGLASSRPATVRLQGRRMGGGGVGEAGAIPASSVGRQNLSPAGA